MSRLLEVGLAMMDIRDENTALRADLERQQAVVRVLRSMDRRGLLGKELRDALAAVDAPPEGDG